MNSKPQPGSSVLKTIQIGPKRTGVSLQISPWPGHLMVRWRTREAHKSQCLAPTLKFSESLAMISEGFYGKTGIGQIGVCWECKIKPGRKLPWKKTCLLQPWQCSHLSGLVFPTKKMHHTTQQGQSKCGWRTTRSSPAMASPISVTEPHWKPLECDKEKVEWSQASKQRWAYSILAPGVAQSHPWATWKMHHSHVTFSFP